MAKRKTDCSLSAKSIKEWNPDKEAWLRDNESRLAVWVRPPGEKQFIFASNYDYQSIRIRLGPVATTDLHKARRTAQQYQAWIDEGRDPREVLKEQKEAEADAKKARKDAEEAERQERERRARYTMAALCNAYVGHLEAQGKISARDARSAFKCHVLEAHPDLAALPAREVTPDHVAAMVRKVRDAGKHNQAGALRSYLRAAFTCAMRARFDSALPADLIPFAVESNPVDPIPTIPVRAGQRTLSADELRGYLAHLGDSLPDQALRLAVLAGGQRMEQLLRAKVSDFDRATGTLRLWDGKGKRTAPREHLLPLAPEGAALAAALADRAESLRLPLLFANPLRDAPDGVRMVATTPGHRCADISQSMGGEPFNLRDIRRTCETQLAGLGISRDTRAQLLSHGLSGVQSTHYDRHGYTAEKRAALVAWEQHLAGAAAANVVNLRGAA